MFQLKIIFLIYICFIANVVKSRENYGIINSKRAINIVDEKFLSISVDPAILLSGVKISSTTEHLASLLTPAYLRLAGPSTAYLDFDPDDSHATSRITDTTNRLVVTPATLAAVNRWTHAANLTPVLAVNELNQHRVNEMLEGMAQGEEGELYWQMGYDNSNKTLDDYVDDIDTLKNMLETFPKQAEKWKILGGDFTNCLGDDKFNIGILKNKLNGVNNIVWERNNKEFDEHFAEQSIKSMMYENQFWTVAPKTSSPISFESAILWANQMGKAANEGFKIIFRQPRIHEFFADTPPFWVSYFHKKFMGRNVLDIRMLDGKIGNVSVFAHCAKRQNNFPKSGAISILIINNATETEAVNLKMSGVLPYSKMTYEVQAFILEGSIEDHSNILLNGNMLSLNEIENNKNIIPKLRRARLNKNLSFEVPSKSIGFFLLPGARLPVCISHEDEEDLILKEIIADQQIKFDEAHDDKVIKSRIFERKANLNDLYQMVEEELETDEKFYKKQAGLTEKTTLVDKIKELKNKQDDSKLVLDMPKILEIKTVEERVQDIKNKIKEKLEAKKAKNNLDLTNNEMVKVLKERAVSKIEKSKGLSESDIEEFIHKALSLKSRQKRAVKPEINRSPLKLFAKANHGQHFHQYGHQQRYQNRNILRRPRRDINMDLLKTKSKTSSKSVFDTGEEIEATFRLPGQTSLELLSDSFEDIEDDEEEKIPAEVFAELAKPEETEQNDVIKKHSFTWDDSMLKPKPKVDFASLFQLPKLKPFASSFEMQPRKGAYVEEDQDKFRDDSFESLEDDDLSGYHGFFEELSVARVLDKPKDIHKRKEYATDELDDESKKMKQKLNKLFDNNKSMRRKRDVKEYTEDDIAFYKKLMQSNIKHMREQMTKSRLRNGMDNFNTGFPKIFPTRSGNIRNDAENTKDKLKIESQKKILKARLNNRKKLEEKKTRNRNLDTLLSKLKSKSKDTNDLGRKKRSSADFNEIYQPNMKLENILQAYEPILQLIKQDLVPANKKSKKYTIEIVDDLEKPVPTMLAAKSKRYINREEEVDMFQDLSHIFNIIEKDSNFIKPFLDEESGEYDIVFPTKDEIKLLKNRGLTQLQFVHKTTTEKAVTENPNDKLTCTANYEIKKAAPTNAELENESINLNLVDYDELTSQDYVNVYIGGEESTTSQVDTSETTDVDNIQRIETEKDKGLARVDVLSKMFGQIRNLVDTIGGTVQKYVKIFHEGEPTIQKNETAIEQ